MVAKTGGINLLPHLTKAEILEERKRNTLTLGTAGVTLVVAVISVLLVLFNTYQNYLVTGVNFSFLTLPGLDSKIDGIKSEIDDYEEVLAAQVELATKVDFVKEVLVGRPDYQVTLDRLQALIPEDLAVDEYEITESNAITISGSTKDYYTLALFVSRAQKKDLAEGYFRDFYLERASYRDESVDFTISAIAVFPEETVIEEL